MTKIKLTREQRIEKARAKRQAQANLRQQSAENDRWLANLGAWRILKELLEDDRGCGTINNQYDLEYRRYKIERAKIAIELLKLTGIALPANADGRWIW